MASNNIIKYKTWDQEFFEEVYEDTLTYKDEMLNKVQVGRADLHYFFREAQDWITLNVFDLKKDDYTKISENFKYAMQVAYGHIKSVESLGKSIKLWVGNKQVTLVNESKSHSYVTTLMNLYPYAIICRCKVVLDLILKNQEDPGPFFHTTSFTTHPSYPLYYLDKSLHKMTDDVIEKQLVKVNNNAKTYFEGDKEWSHWYKEVYLPLSELRHQFYIGTEVGFNKKLQIALDKNRIFYDSERDDNCRDTKAWFPMEIIAYASRAYDKGWKITVKDSRLPMFLIEGKCKVENLESIH